MKRQFTIVLWCLALAIQAAASAQQSPRADIHAFVQRDRFPHSYDEVAAAFDASVTPELVAMLGSSSEDDNWEHIANMLGIVGDERAVDALIAFVSRPEPQSLPQTHHHARMAAIMSLGLLVNRTGSERALTYLIDGLKPRAWDQRGVEGMPSGWGSRAEYNSLLSEYALFALALSGNPRAGEALRSLQQSPTPEQAQFRQGLDATLAQWLEVHQLVAERGVSGMYKYYADQRQRDVEQATEEATRLRDEQEEERSLREAQDAARRMRAAQDAARRFREGQTQP